VVLGTLDPPAGLPREAEMVGLTVQIGDTIGGDVGGEGGVHLVLQQAVLATKTSIQLRRIAPHQEDAPSPAARVPYLLPTITTKPLRLGRAA
jgi:hypothetical protein